MFSLEYFGIKELVSESAWQRWKHYDKVLWQQFDVNALYFLDWLRGRFGSMTINDWSWGGNNHWRGLRLPESPFWSDYSQHSRGKAFDCIFKDVSAEEVRCDLIKNFDKLQPIQYITLEDEVSWLHFDVRYQDKPITLFKP